MKELVYKSEKGTPVTTSLLVSKKFEKQHKDVLEAIRTLAENSADLPGIKNMFFYFKNMFSFGDMKNCSIFAASEQETKLHSTICSSYFYGYTDAALSKDIRLSIHNGLLHSCCNLSLARSGKIAFLFLVL
jgi:hypothetical protein